MTKDDKSRAKEGMSLAEALRRKGEHKQKSRVEGKRQGQAVASREIKASSRKGER